MSPLWWWTNEGWVWMKRCKNISLHQPGIEPRANAWKAFMLPLHHWCLSCQTRYTILYILLIIFFYTIPNNLTHTPHTTNTTTQHTLPHISFTIMHLQQNTYITLLLLLHLQYHYQPYAVSTTLPHRSHHLSLLHYGLTDSSYSHIFPLPLKPSNSMLWC